MPEPATTQQLTITLPSELAKLVRERIASGEYASESDFVRDTIVCFTQSPALDEANEGWLRREAILQSAEADAHPEQLLELDELRRSLEEARKAQPSL